MKKTTHNYNNGQITPELPATTDKDGTRHYILDEQTNRLYELRTVATDKGKTPLGWVPVRYPRDAKELMEIATNDFEHIRDSLVDSLAIENQAIARKIALGDEPDSGSILKWAVENRSIDIAQYQGNYDSMIQAAIAAWKENQTSDEYGAEYVFLTLL